MLGLKLHIVLPIIAAMVLLRWRRVGMLTWALAWWVALLSIFELGFVTPIPASVVKLYMGIVTAALFTYVSSSTARWDSFFGPVLRLVLEPRYRAVLVILLLVIPLLAATNVYVQMNVPLEAPGFDRTIHPAPPDTITVHETDFDLIHGDNPYRALEESDKAAFEQHLENGRRVYYQNCFFCHGDAMAGDGMFIYGLNPIPTNFTDASVLQNLQETFLFWRVSKGGPGLPEEGGPWDSAMPAWEKFLTVDEVWDVILYLYEYNGLRPRKEEAEL